MTGKEWYFMKEILTLLEGFWYLSFLNPSRINGVMANSSVDRSMQIDLSYNTVRCMLLHISFELVI